jgi:hypothetical protein
MRGARLSGLIVSAVFAVGVAAPWPAWAAQVTAPPDAAASSRVTVPQATAYSHSPAGATVAALPAPVPCDSTAGPCWHPQVDSRWQYQLQGSINSSGQCIYPATGFINTNITGTSFATGLPVAAVVFDTDIYQDGKCYTPNNYGVLNNVAFNALHAMGDKVIGYIDAGTAETWRPDYPQYQNFNASCGGCLFGKPVSHFRDEYWLNINTDVYGINPNTGQRESAQQFIIDELAARLDKAKSVGADAIEFDDVDAYQNKTGLTISAATQGQYNATIANLAHSVGFTVGLKNDVGQVNDLQPYFDFSINEQCWQYKECNYPPPGLQAWPSSYGKAVFNVEYKLKAANFCPQADSPSYNFNSILKDYNLYDVPYTPCR